MRIFYMRILHTGTDKTMVCASTLAETPPPAMQDRLRASRAGLLASPYHRHGGIPPLRRDEGEEIELMKKDFAQAKSFFIFNIFVPPIVGED